MAINIRGEDFFAVFLKTPSGNREIKKKCILLTQRNYVTVNQRLTTVNQRLTK